MVFTVGNNPTNIDGEYFAGGNWSICLLMSYQAWAGHSLVTLHLNPLTRIFTVTLGSSLGLLFTNSVYAKAIGRTTRILLNLMATITVIVLLSLMFFMNGRQNINYQWGMQVYSLVAALMVSLSMHPSSWIYRLLSARPWAWFERQRLTSLLWALSSLSHQSRRVGSVNTYLCY